MSHLSLNSRSQSRIQITTPQNWPTLRSTFQWGLEKSCFPSRAIKVHDLSVSVCVTWNLRGNRELARDWPISSSGDQSAQRARASCGVFYGMLNAPDPHVASGLIAAGRERACVRRSRLEHTVPCKGWSNKWVIVFCVGSWSGMKK